MAKSSVEMTEAILDSNIFAFFWIVKVFEVYHSLPQPSLKTMDRVVSRAIDLCTFIYLGVGIAGYLAFVGVTHITGNVLVAFEPSLVTVAMKVCPC